MEEVAKTRPLISAKERGQYKCTYEWLDMSTAFHSASLMLNSIMLYICVSIILPRLALWASLNLWMCMSSFPPTTCCLILANTLCVGYTCMSYKLNLDQDRAQDATLCRRQWATSIMTSPSPAAPLTPSAPAWAAPVSSDKTYQHAHVYVGGDVCTMFNATLGWSLLSD